VPPLTVASLATTMHSTLQWKHNICAVLCMHVKILHYLLSSYLAQILILIQILLTATILFNESTSKMQYLPYGRSVPEGITPFPCKIRCFKDFWIQHLIQNSIVYHPTQHITGHFRQNFIGQMIQQTVL